MRTTAATATVAYRDQHDVVLDLAVAVTELLEQRPIVLEVGRRQMGGVELLPVRGGCAGRRHRVASESCGMCVGVCVCCVWFECLLVGKLGALSIWRAFCV